jgi:hypothetical protein
MTTTHGIDVKTREIIEAAVHAHLGSLTLKSIDIRPDTDRDGMDWLDIDLHYNASGHALPARTEREILRSVNDALQSHGDDRIPYIQHFYEPATVTGGFERAS